MFWSLNTNAVYYRFCNLFLLDKTSGQLTQNYQCNIDNNNPIVQVIRNSEPISVPGSSCFTLASGYQITHFVE
jgi:hypothetical protein